MSSRAKLNTIFLWVIIIFTVLQGPAEAEKLKLSRNDLDTWNNVKGPAAASIFNYAKSTIISCLRFDVEETIKCSLLERTNSVQVFYSDSGEYALAVIYFSPDSGNALWFDASIFRRKSENVYNQQVRIYGLIGQTNSAHFKGNDLFVTTETLQENDARCCPTGRTDWLVDLKTGKASYVSGFADPNWKLKK